MFIEKRSSLTLPESSQISVTEKGILIISESDIIIQGTLFGATVRSLKGDINIFSPKNEKQCLNRLEAPNGVITIIGEDFEIDEIESKGLFADANSLISKTISVEKEAIFNRGSAQITSIVANSLHFSGANFTSQHIKLSKDASFSAESVKAQTIQCEYVDFKVTEKLKLTKLMAQIYVNLACKTLDIDYLFTQDLQVTPETEGVILCINAMTIPQSHGIIGMLPPEIFLEKMYSLSELTHEIRDNLQENLLSSHITETTAENKVSLTIVESQPNILITRNDDSNLFLSA